MNSIRDFLSQFPNQSTRETYFYGFKGFLETLFGHPIRNENLDSECEEFFQRIISEHGKSLDDALQQFSEKVEATHHAPKTVNLYMNVMIMYARERGISVSPKTLRFLKMALPRNQAISKEDELDLATFQKMLNAAPIRLKAEIMVLGSSGMRIGELLKIKDADIDFTSNPTAITLRQEYTKTKTARVVFISAEATRVLKEWIQKRDQLKEQGKIKPDETRIFPFTKANECACLRRHLDKCGLLKIDPVTHRTTIHFHLFRKFFLTEFKQVASPEVAEELAGHKGYLSDSYRRLTRKTMKEEYLKAETALTFMAESLRNLPNENTVIGLIVKNKDGRMLIQFGSPAKIPIT